MTPLVLQIVPLAIAAATPLLLAVIGELTVERSGVINLGLEGMMLTAAMTAVLAAQASHSILIGVAGGVAGAVGIALVFGIAAIAFRTDQIVAGTAVNFLALGLTGVVYRQLQESGVFEQGVPHFGTGGVPGLRSVPIIGPILFAQDVLIPLVWLVLPIVATGVLWNSRFGLRLRACGENPAAATANGFSVDRYRWAALMVEAGLAGTAGAYLSLSLANGFAENMVSGRGFIALAIVIFGRWRLRGAIAGASLFGAAAATQFAFQALGRGVPFHLLLALPYIATIAILCGVTGAVRSPEALGKRE
jgi:ABC-type uncharacterized transport system permease subunit